LTAALLDKSQYKAQIEDIISLSVQKVYQAPEVIEKEVAGYKIIADLLEVICTAFVAKAQDRPGPYDALILKLVPTHAPNRQYRHLRTAHGRCYLRGEFV
jgi:dGTPase